VDSPSASAEGSLLHLACANNDADACRTLLSAGANPCIQNDANKTPLQMAKSDAVRRVFHQELLHAIAQSKYV
jgi:ankyrin repeat protein